MKKFIAIALVLVLTMCLFAGCRSPQNDSTGGDTGTRDTNGSNMLPDGGDTIDPTNGANQEPTQNTQASEPMPTNDTNGSNGNNDTNGSNGTNGSSGTDNNTNGRSGNNGSRIFPQH